MPVPTKQRFTVMMDERYASDPFQFSKPQPNAATRVCCSGSLPAPPTTRFPNTL
jgi:hypothetical protein